jgi:LCP family protein required for cell wall assembly
MIVLSSGYGWAAYRKVVHDTRTVDAIASSPKASPTPSRSGAGKPATATKAENILLVGDDDRTGATPAELKELNTQADGGAANTDTMILLHIPADGSRATGISFPRDSWVDIPGHGMNKLNAAYGLGSANGGGDSGGAQLLIATIQNLSGVHIDHYVAVSLLGFYRIATALGPIQVCLLHPAHDPNSGTNLPAGVSTLNASQALSFVRQRDNLPHGDLDREVRQQYFLSAELRKVLTPSVLLNPFALNKVIDAVSSSIVKDPGLNLAEFAEQAENLTAGQVKFATIPIVNANGHVYSDIYHEQLSIVEVDPAKVRAFLAAQTGGVATVKPSTSPKASTATAAAPKAYSASDCIN